MLAFPPGTEIVVSPPATVAANVLLDEALARSAFSTGRSQLRFWWGTDLTVVVARSERIEEVAWPDRCRRDGVAIVRRVSGGGAVLQGPGVLNYSWTAPDDGFLPVDRAFALGGLLTRRALVTLGVAAASRGISDVAVGDRKISGSAQARVERGILLHGTLLIDLEPDLVSRYLKHPLREPDYRCGRSHADFIVSLRRLLPRVTDEDVMRACLAAARLLIRPARPSEPKRGET